MPGVRRLESRDVDKREIQDALRKVYLLSLQARLILRGAGGVMRRSAPSM